MERFLFSTSEFKLTINNICSVQRGITLLNATRTACAISFPSLTMGPKTRTSFSFSLEKKLSRDSRPIHTIRSCEYYICHPEHQRCIHGDCVLVLEILVLELHCVSFLFAQYSSTINSWVNWTDTYHDVPLP